MQLFSSLRKVNRDKDPIDEGIAPMNEFLLTSSNIRDDIVQSEEGRDPVNRFPHADKIESNESEPTHDGIGPTRELPPTSRDVKEGIVHSDEGMVPARQLVWIPTSCS